MKTGRLIPGRIDVKSLLLLFLIFHFGYTPSLGFASEHKEETKKETTEEPKDSFNLILSYTDVTIGPGQDFEMDAEVVNRTKNPVHVSLSTESVPEGWKVSFNSRFPSYPVRGVMVKGEESNTLELKAKVPEKAKPGSYEIKVVAKDRAGVTKQVEKVKFQIASKKVETGGLKLESQYPDLSGPTSQTFKFTVDLKNETDDALTTALAAQAPPGWRMRIKPQFEDTQISSIAIKKDSTETLSVEIDPPLLAEVGEYPVTIKARSGPFEAAANLKIKLTGTYDLKVGTSTGILNTSVTAGKKAQVVFLVGNAGTAALRNLSFLSKKPEKWNIDFNPDKIDSLNPGEVREVKMEIMTPGRTIAGDYLLTVTSNSPDVNKAIDFRVTVLTPTLWGWIGFGIVAAVVLGLGAVFVRLGRR
ncbi:MAG: NEW3 domain-containing protein [Candidatus Binatia bacterium]